MPVRCERVAAIHNLDHAHRHAEHRCTLLTHHVRSHFAPPYRWIGEPATSDLHQENFSLLLSFFLDHNQGHVRKHVMHGIDPDETLGKEFMIRDGHIMGADSVGYPPCDGAFCDHEGKDTNDA